MASAADPPPRRSSGKVDQQFINGGRAIETLAEMITDALGGALRPRSFAERRGATDWRFTSSRAMLARATAIARALRATGAVPGDRVALIAHNRVDWIAADFGILLQGCVVVPIFATLALDQIVYILRDCRAKLCFVETAEDAARLRAAYPGAPRAIYFDGTGPDSLATFEQSGERSGGDASGNGHAGDAPDGMKSPPAPDTLAVLVYTSGTTGDPKGVMLSHRNLISNARAAVNMLPSVVRAGGQPVLSVLPFAHIYEHTILNTYVCARAELYITQPAHFMDDLKSVRPRVMALVPRIFERVLAGIVGRAHADGGLKAKLVPWALQTGRTYAAALQAGIRPGPLQTVRYALARRLVFAKIKTAVGLDRLEYFTSGGAPLHRDVALTFAGMGIAIAEGYGLTETSPIVTASSADAIRYGSVGKAIAGVEVRIADDGEIFVRGPGVMLGYYDLPDEHPITSDGWFATGDIGTLDAQGYLYITDRKKELIKTSTGKYVAPGRVEAALKRSVYVSQTLVVGDGRPHPAALICPNWDLVRKRFGIAEDVATQTIAARTDVHEFMRCEVVEHSKDLASFEAIRRIALLPHELTVENGELSPTHKIKRRIVEMKFAALIASAYAEPRQPAVAASA